MIEVGYWDTMGRLNPPPGPTWELENGKQIRLDYRAVSLIMEWLKQGGGNLFIQQRKGNRSKGEVWSCDTLWMEFDGERIFFEHFTSYPKSDSDLMDGGGFPSPNDRPVDATERFWMLWDPDYSTSVTWEWTPGELESHLAFDGG